MLEEVYPRAESGHLPLERGLLLAVGARQVDGICGEARAVGGDLSLEGGIAGRVVGSREVLDVVGEPGVGFGSHGCGQEAGVGGLCVQH